MPKALSISPFQHTTFPDNGLSPKWPSSTQLLNGATTPLSPHPIRPGASRAVAPTEVLGCNPPPPLAYIILTQFLTSASALG